MKKFIIFVIICLSISVDMMAQSHLLLKRENWTFKEVNGAPTSFTKKYIPIDPAPINPKKVYYRLPAKVIHDTVKLTIVEKPVNNNFYRNSYSVISAPATPKTMVFMPSVGKTIAADPFQLKAQYREGRNRIIGGSITAAVGGAILFSQWKPTEINTKVIVNSKGVSVSAKTVTHVAENTAIAVVSSAFIAGGVKLIAQGCKRIKASGNGLILTF